MRIQIATRNGDVPETVRDRARTQVERLTRYEPRLSSAEIVFDEERHIRKVEGILSVDGSAPVVASGEGDDFRPALDQMLDRVSRMLRRQRDQRTDHKAPRREGGDRVVGD